MESVLLSVIVGTFTILSYTLGLKQGQRVVRGQEVQMPQLNPIKVVKQSVLEKEAQEKLEKEINRLSTAMENIENYDGTSKGQKEV